MILCNALVTNKLFFHLVLKDGSFLANHHGSREKVTRIGYSRTETKWVADHFEVQVGVYSRLHGPEGVKAWVMRAMGPLIIAGQRASTQ